MNIKEQAEAHEGKSFKSIDEMEKINTDVEILEGHGEVKSGENKGETFDYHYFMDDDTEVRVPNSVLAQLKEQLKANPELAAFKVAKSGSGLNTKYTVIPLKD